MSLPLTSRTPHTGFLLPISTPSQSFASLSFSLPNVGRFCSSVPLPFCYLHLLRSAVCPPPISLFDLDSQILISCSDLFPDSHLIDLTAYSASSVSYLQYNHLKLRIPNTKLLSFLHIICSSFSLSIKGNYSIVLAVTLAKITRVTLDSWLPLSSCIPRVVCCLDPAFKMYP